MKNNKIIAVLLIPIIAVLFLTAFTWTPGGKRPVSPTALPAYTHPQNMQNNGNTIEEDWIRQWSENHLCKPPLLDRRCRIDERPWLTPDATEYPYP